MQRQPYSETSLAQSNSQTWFDVKNSSPSGALVNYLMDPKHIFTSELAKNITKLANNLSHDYDHRACFDMKCRVPWTYFGYDGECAMNERTVMEASQGVIQVPE